MKRKTIHFALAFLLAIPLCNNLFAQVRLKPIPAACMDCSIDSVQHLFKLAKNSRDSLLAYVVQLDGTLGPEEHLAIRASLTRLLALNQKLNLFDDKPYKLYLEAINLWDQRDTLKSLEKNKEAITAFDQQYRIQSITGILSVIRTYYNYANLHEDRLAFYQEKLKYYQANGPIENTAICLHGIAGYYLYKADYNTAISYYLKAAEIFKPISLFAYGNEFTVVGLTYYRWGNFDKALPYLKEGRTASLNVGNFSNVQMSTLILSMIAKHNKQYDKALALCDTSFTMLHLPRDLNQWTIAMAEKGSIYLEMDQPELAFTYISRSVAMRDSAAIPIFTVQGDFEGYFYLYQYYKKTGDRTEAEKALLRTYNKSIEGKSNAQILKVQKELASFYATEHKDELALPYALEYIALNDSLHNTQNEFNVSQYERQQVELANEKELLGLEQQKKLQRNYFAGGGVLLLFFSVGIFSRLQFVRRVKKQLEEKNRQVEKAKQRAEQSEQFKQVFLANMSHEIRTPMNAVMGMTNLLLDKEPRHDQLTYLSGIQQSSDTLLHIINDILDLSKIEAGKIELEEIDFSIRDEVRQVKQLLEQKAEEKGLQLNMNIKPDVPKVLVGDPVRLKQVLINLAGNAIKFTEKGSVAIEVSSVTSFDINHETPGVKTRLQFKISDTGIGIPKDKLDSVFESFSQAHASDNRKFGGTGLGLSISKQLVELMGGTIAVESEEGSGTSFSFEIEYPVGSVEKLHTNQNQNELDGSILNGLKILVVDDNEFNRTVARDTLLSKADVEITEAFNGQEALDLFAQRDFDVILMDVQMPVMDGFEATRQIRENFPSPKNKIQIIALTASVVRSDLDRCRAAGMDEYVAKPFKTAQLLATIAKATGREITFIKNSIHAETIADIEEIATAKSQQIKIADLSYLEKFCEGDQVKMKKYINMYLDTAPGLIERIELALQQENYDEIASQVHAYKTKWIMMGMTEAKELALVIENDCRQGGNAVVIKENVEKLFEQIQGASAEFMDRSWIQN